MFQFLSENDKATAFPNLFIALRIYLTISVSVVSGESSFSRLKLIKNYLRSESCKIACKSNCPAS